jgi:hypothetical protein
MKYGMRRDVAFAIEFHVKSVPLFGRLTKKRLGLPGLGILAAILANVGNA